MSKRHRHRSRYLAWMHAIAVVLGLWVVLVRDVSSPDIGISIAIAVLAGLGIRSTPKPTDPDILRSIHGSVTNGGIRQGVFIKSMFTIALLYMGVYQIHVGTMTTGITNVVLGVALGLSSIASELEAWEVRQAIRSAD